MPKKLSRTTQGFFSDADVGEEPILTRPNCEKCGLYLGCSSPKMPLTGRGLRKVLIAAEAPGEEEDKRGVQLIGKSGQKLRLCLADIGIDLDRDCWKTNSVICFTGDARVETSSPVEIGFRRRYSGSLVSIYTLSGRTLTGTPNHPVLTSFGWIALGLLKEGDDLVCCTFAERSGFCGTNIDDPPPKFEEFFKSLSEVGNVQRVVGGRVDFHGDGEDGDVDVVGVDGFLSDRFKPMVLKNIREKDLVFSGGAAGCLFGFGVGGRVSYDFFDGPFSSFRGEVGCFGKSFSSVNSNPVHSDLHSHAFVSQLNTGSGKYCAKFLEGETKRISKRLKSLSGFVTIDRIVKIERRFCDKSVYGFDASKRSTHVYNLQTVDGYYTMNGIVVSNCRPSNNETNDDHIRNCRPQLFATIEELKPEVVILLGASPVKSLIGNLWRKNENPGMISQWVGWKIPSQRLNAWICPTWHPAYLLYENNPVLELWFRKHLEEAFKLNGVPWPDGVPDYAGQVDLLFDPGEAAAVLRKMISRGGTASFDYETNMKKPDHPDARIVSCAVCWEGKKTIAYPWQGEAIKATSELLLSPDVRKVGWSIKFEERWTKARLGHWVRGWIHDGMIATHVLDNRPKITSAKFQAFVRLGLSPWDEEVGPFLKDSKGSNSKNKIDQVNLKTLLKYNGIDAIAEFLIYQKQAEEIGGG